MTNLGLPVPPGLHHHHRGLPGLPGRGPRAGRDGRRGLRAPRRPREGHGPHASGDPEDPLLVSVRSGAKFSMPGMMETVLNVGLNDESVRGLARQSDDERFALDSYRRLLQMFGGHRARHRRRALRRRPRRGEATHGTDNDLDLDADDLRALVDDLPADRGEARRAALPPGPARAARPGDPRRLRLVEHRPRPCSTAGRSGSPRTSAPRSTSRPWSSATSAWTPARASPSPATRPAGTRASTATTCRTPRARTSSPGSATRCRSPTSRRSTRGRYDELMTIMARLERHYRDMCDIEFTVERGKLWMLQTRVGKRTPEAAFRIAMHMVDEGLIGMDEAVLRVTGDQLAQLMFPRFDADAERTLLATGMNASPGAAVGKAVFDSDDRRRVGGEGRGRDPGPQGDQPRRPARDGGRPRHPDQPGRQDLPRCGRRARHGPDLRLRRGGPRRGRQGARSSGSATARPSARAT